MVVPSGQVDVWLSDLDRCPRHPEWLSPEERFRSSRFVREIHRERFIASRTVLRSLLGRYLAEDPARIRLSAGPQGKPFAAGSTLRFNLSHSHSAAVYAFSGEFDVGIDIEKMAEERCVESLARRILTPGEFDEWMKLDDQRRVAAFYRVWTRKEALIKATGEGLAREMSTFPIPWAESAFQAGDIWLLPFAAPEGYEASLAAITVSRPSLSIHRFY